MSEKNKVSGKPENETLWEKTKRHARTAGNWCKTHWKGLALGAVAIGGGAYMLTRHNDGEGEDEPVRMGTGGSLDYREEIGKVFDSGDGSDVGPTDDEPDEDDGY